MRLIFEIYLLKISLDARFPLGYHIDRPENAKNGEIWDFRLISGIFAPSEKTNIKMPENQMESLSFPSVTTQTTLKILKWANLGF